jgi:hypothetical protein
VALGGALILPDGVPLLPRGHLAGHLAGRGLGDDPLPGLGDLLLPGLLHLLQHLGAEQAGSDQLGSLDREEGQVLGSPRKILAEQTLHVAIDSSSGSIVLER